MCVCVVWFCFWILFYLRAPVGRLAARVQKVLAFVSDAVLSAAVYFKEGNDCVSCNE